MTTLTELDFKAYTPLYLQLQLLIQRQIEGGQLNPGDAVPSESELTQRYQVSRITARQALQGLVREGYIYRQRGRGSFVAHFRADQHSQRHGEVMEELRRRGWVAESRILDFGPTDSPEVYRELLDIREEQWVLAYRRLILANGDPLMVSSVIVVMDKGMEVTRDDLATTSVFPLLRQRYGRDFGHTELAFGAVTASTELAAVLKVPPGSPLLSKDALTRLVDGTRCALGRAFFRGDRYRYFTTVLGLTSDE
jgi:GntR family transcriptional regulator